jgi:hypothetical protein
MGKMKNNMTQKVSSNNNESVRNEIDKKEEEKKKQASQNLYFFHKEIQKTGALIAVLMCRTCEANSALGDLLDQLGKKELIALKERINARLFFMKGESEP